MNSIKIDTVFRFLFATSFVLVVFTSCQKQTNKEIVLVTQTKANVQNNQYKKGNLCHFPKESRIVTLSQNKTEITIKVLTKDFFSACAPQVSFDGKSIVFAGQRNEKDIWQIFEMNLENQKVHQVTTSTKENCTDPLYLPDGRLLFSKLTDIAQTSNVYALFSCNKDGSKISQITFSPNAYFASRMLKDGRVLTFSQELFPIQKNAVFLVLRPDGTKERLFYKGIKGSYIRSSGKETENGKILFIESNDRNKKRNICAVNYNNPVESKTNLTKEIEGDFYAVSPWRKDSLLVTYRSSKNNLFKLYSFNTKSNSLGKVFYEDAKYNTIDAVIIKKHQRPRKLPSEVNLKFNSGLMLCQDINFTDSLQVGLKANKVEVLGIDKTLRTVNVEKDGSFYIKIIADTPFRLQTIGKNGQVVNGPSNWMYMRPGERRGCVGCHENREQVPENRQPLSVQKGPIQVPENIKKETKKKEY